MTTTKPSPNRAKRVTWLALLAAIPIIAILLSAVVLLSRQRAAAAEFERLAGAEGSGDARLAALFAERTSSQGTIAWSKILTLCTYTAWGEVNNLPIIGNGTLPEEISPQVPWPQEELVAEYLSEMRPTIELIHEAADVPKPVWQPMEFNGLETLLPELQDSRSIARLLQLEALFAIHLGDADRALAAMRSMQATADAFDWHMFLVGELVNLALNGMLDDTVGKALQADIWTPEQIDALQALVNQPIPIAEKWRSAFEAEELWTSTALSSQMPASMLVSDSQKLNFFQHYQQLKALADAPLAQLSERARAWDRNAELQRDSSFGESTLYNWLIPSAESVAIALERAEYRRRLTLTAVGVKRYKLKNDTWPNALADLADVGLSEDDWSIPSLGPFGFRVNDDTAVVFAYSHDQDINIQLPNTIRPTPGAKYDEVLIR